MKPIYHILIILLIASCRNRETKEENHSEFVESNCHNLPNISFEPDSILHEMQVKLSDSLWSQYWKPEHNRIMNELNAYKDKGEKLFPYSDYDSAIFIFYEPHNKVDYASSTEKRSIKNFSVICQEKVTLLLKVINDPLNYSTAECGTSIPFSQVIFYLKDKKIGELTFSCNYSSIGSNPKNTMIFGNLNNRGDSLLNMIKPWN